MFGKLFPLSPVFPGFSKTEKSNIDIYAQKGSKVPDLTVVNAMTPEIEAFHTLKYIHKPKLFLFRDSLSYVRHSFSKARFCVYPGGRLFISPWAVREAEAGKISLRIYVKHELSHVLILQHKGYFGQLYYPKWLLEGLAVYSADQMGTSFYPDKRTTLKAIAQGNFIPPEDFKTRRENKYRLNVQNPIAFAYSEYACMVDFLIIKYGKVKFLAYMKGLLDSNNQEEVFRKVYGVDFSTFVQDFKTYAGLYENRFAIRTQSRK